MPEENYKDRLKQLKAQERQKIQSHATTPPSLADFWSQPHAVRLIMVHGDVLSRVPSVVKNRGGVIVEQHVSETLAYPAHVGTLLSRRRRGRWSVAMAAWYSNGWTKVQETTGGTIATDEIQLRQIATALSATTVGIMYWQLESMISLITVDGDGQLTGHTTLTSVATEPRGPLWHPEIVADPKPEGLAKALLKIGLDIELHVSERARMVTVRNTEGF